MLSAGNVMTWFGNQWQQHHETKEKWSGSSNHAFDKEVSIEFLISLATV
jgi:hypothetical protein